MTVCIWDLLNELWDALGTWIDGDTNGAVSSISPAGQLYHDCRSMTGNGESVRSKDIGALGDGNYTVYIRFKGDVWDGTGVVGNSGIYFAFNGATYRCIVVIGNQCDGSTDGVWVYDGSSYVKAVTKTWDNDWHTIRLDVHNGQTDVDIYIDDESSPSKTDADCTFGTGNDGDVVVVGRGTVAGNGEYHIDYIKINDGLCNPIEEALLGGGMFKI